MSFYVLFGCFYVIMCFISRAVGEKEKLIRCRPGLILICFLQFYISIGYNAKLPPTILWSTEGPKILSADTSMMPITLSQKEDAQRIPKMDTQAWTKAVRSSDMEKRETGKTSCSEIKLTFNY